MTSGSNNYYRSLFLSDLHLGSHKTKADRLYKFLKKNHAYTIYLVGDVFDGHYDKPWPASHIKVLDLLMKRMLRGVRIIFVPGNHDAVFRQHYGEYGNLTITENAMHVMVDGRCILVMHGDETDMFRISFVLKAIIRIERITRWHLWEIFRRWASKLIDGHTKKFEQKMMKFAQGYAGVACGHIHKPNIVNDTLIYLNSGDWVHHCSAIAEKTNGEFVLLYG